MGKVNTGGNAFPTGTWEYDGQNNVLPYQEKGMSLRDYFAAKAMQSLYLSALEWEPTGKPRDKQSLNIIEELVCDAYQIADIMIAERERGE